MTPFRILLGTLAVAVAGSAGAAEYGQFQADKNMVSFRPTKVR